jgi:hypothetical protein
VSPEDKKVVASMIRVVVIFIALYACALRWAWVEGRVSTDDYLKEKYGTCVMRAKERAP